MTTKRLLRLQVRVAVYVAVIAALFLVRGGMDWDRLLSRVPSTATPDSTLSLTGIDLAPELVDRILAHYRRDYPRVRITAAGGGTNRALEELANRRTDVAFLARPPSPDEQRLFRSAGGDTALWFPIALGGIAFLQARNSSDSLTVEEIRSFLGDEAGPRFDRLYAPDPNLGLWDAFLGVLSVFPPGTPPPVVFLESEHAVIESVRGDPRSLGLASSLSLPEDLEPLGVRTVAVRSGAGAWAFPTYHAVGSGDYPLRHHLLVSCRGNGGIQGAKFVTHLTSARGQRQVERAGFLPARRVLREIVLTRNAPGESE